MVPRSMQRYPKSYVIWCAGGLLAFIFAYRMFFVWAERTLSETGFVILGVCLILATLAAAWAFDARKSKQDSK
jgi:hypothetical protein